MFPCECSIWYRIAMAVNDKDFVCVVSLLLSGEDHSTHDNCTACIINGYIRMIYASQCAGFFNHHKNATGLLATGKGCDRQGKLKIFTR